MNERIKNKKATLFYLAKKRPVGEWSKTNRCPNLFLIRLGIQYDLSHIDNLFTMDAPNWTKCPSLSGPLFILSLSGISLSLSLFALSLSLYSLTLSLFLALAAFFSFLLHPFSFLHSHFYFLICIYSISLLFLCLFLKISQTLSTFLTSFSLFSLSLCFLRSAYVTFSLCPWPSFSNLHCFSLPFIFLYLSQSNLIFHGRLNLFTLNDNQEEEQYSNAVVL